MVQVENVNQTNVVINTFVFMGDAINSLHNNHRINTLILVSRITSYQGQEDDNS